jgi:hypothetical protein
VTSRGSEGGWVGGFPEAGRGRVPYSGGMASVRPLRELLADLVGDTSADSGDAYLAEHGHPDLPAELVAEAVVNFADTAPPELAEQLAPFVTAHTAGQTADWFDVLTSAQPGLADDPDEGLDGGPVAEDFSSDPGAELDFGAGAVDALDFEDSFEAEVAEAAAPTNWSETEQISADVASSDVLDGDVVAEDEQDEEPDEDSLD